MPQTRSLYLYWLKIYGYVHYGLFLWTLPWRREGQIRERERERERERQRESERDRDKDK